MKNNKELSNNKKYEKEYEFVTVNFSTGDQFRKIATLRSENGPITFEQVRKFYDESAAEEREWRKNHPGESVTIRISEDENGGQKQIIETTPKKDLICSNFRIKVYDKKTGKEIVGEENIRKEIERREANWEQWEKEGKLEKVNHEVHHTDDGSIVSIFTMLPPVDAERVHPNENNDKTKWVLFGIGDNRIEGGKESQKIDENKTNEERGKEENVWKENIEDEKIVEKIKKDINEWSVKTLVFTLSNGSKGKKDCLVNSSAKINKSELGNLIYPVEIFTDSEKKELSEVLNDSFLVNFVTSGEIRKESLSKNNCHSISLPETLVPYDNAQQLVRGKNVLIVCSVVFVVLVAGLAIIKSRFSKIKGGKSQ